MPTLTWLDSFQHQFANTTSYGTNAGIYDTALRTVGMSFVAGRRPGTFALQIVEDALTSSRVGKLVAAGNKVVVESFYIRVTAKPSVDSHLWVGVAFINTFVGISSATGFAYASVAGGTQRNGAVDLSDSAWHRVDVKLDTTTTTYKLDVSIDGTALTQATNTSTIADITETRLGSTAAAHTLTCQYADWVRSVTSADHPIGPHRVDALIPDADGAHNWASTNMGPNTGGVASSVTTLWQTVDDWATVTGDTTTYIQYANTTATGTEYAEITLPDVSADTTVWGARAVAAIFSATTTANSATTRVVDGGGSTVLDLYVGDMSDTSLRHQATIVPSITTASGLNALKYRVGFPTDSNPAPRWSALMIEYASPEAPPEVVNADSNSSGGKLLTGFFEEEDDDDRDFDYQYASLSTVEINASHLDVVVNGTASPATVVGTGSVPAPTATGTATASSATVVGTGSVPAPTATGAATAVPAIVVGTGSVPAPTASGNATASPATVVGIGAVPAPTATGGTGTSDAELLGAQPAGDYTASLFDWQPFDYQTSQSTEMSAMGVESRLAPNLSTGNEPFTWAAETVLNGGNTVFNNSSNSAVSSRELAVGTQARFVAGDKLFELDAASLAPQNRWFSRFNFAVSGIVTSGDGAVVAAWNDSSQVGALILVPSTNQLRIVRRNGTTLSTSSTVIQPDTVYRLEFLAELQGGFQMFMQCRIFLDPTSAGSPDETISGTDSTITVSDTNSLGPVIGQSRGGPVPAFSFSQQGYVATFYDDFAAATDAYPAPTGSTPDANIRASLVRNMHPSGAEDLATLFEWNPAGDLTGDPTSHDIASYFGIVASVDGTATPATVVGIGLVPAPTATGTATASPATVAVVDGSLWNSFEGGTNGVSVTTGNSGGVSGDAIDGPFGKFSNAQAAHGSLSLNEDTPIIEYTTSFGTQHEFWGRGYFYFTSRTSSYSPIIQASVGAQCEVDINSSGQIELRVGGSGTASASGSVISPLNAWFRVEWHIRAETTTSSSDGFIEAKLFLTMDSVTPDETITFATANMGSSTTFGRVSCEPDAVGFNTIWIDDFDINLVGYPGPYPNLPFLAVPAPTATGNATAAPATVVGIGLVPAPAALGGAQDAVAMHLGGSENFVSLFDWSLFWYESDAAAFTSNDTAWELSPFNATASPATVVGTGSVPPPTAIGNATAVPAAVVGTGSVPAPTVTGTATASPATVVGAGSVPPATATGAATAAPGVVVGIGSVPAPTATGASAGTALPSTVAGIGSVPAPTFILAPTITPATVAGVGAVGGGAFDGGFDPGFDTGARASGDANTFPATVVGIGNVPAPTASGSTAATATPATVAGIGSVPPPTAMGAATAAPAAVVGTGSVPPPTVTGTATAQPTAVVGTGAVPPPTAMGNATAVPAAVVGTGAVTTPTALGGAQDAVAMHLGGGENFVSLFDWSAFWTEANAGINASVDVTGAFFPTINATALPATVVGTGAVTQPTATGDSQDAVAVHLTGGEFTATIFDWSSFWFDADAGATASHDVTAQFFPTISATASPATVVGTGSVPPPTAIGNATAAPATTAAIGDVPAPAASGGSVGTATPGAVQGTGSIPAPTVTGNATAAPNTTAGTGSVPPATGSVFVTALPGSVTGTGAVPPPTSTGTANASPGAVSGVGTVPAPTASGNATAAPATVAGVGSVPPATATGTATAAPATTAGTATITAPTTTGTATTTPATVAGVGSVPPATAVGATSSTATPGVVAGTGSVPPASATGLATALPSVTAGTGSVPPVSASGAATATPATTAGLGSVPAPSASGGSVGTATPGAVQGVATIITPTILLAPTVKPATVAGIGTVPPPTATGGTAATASPATVAGIGRVPAPTAIGGSATTATPTTVQGTATVPVPTVYGSFGAFPATVAAVSTIPVPTFTADGTAHPGSVAAIGNVPPPSDVGQIRGEWPQTNGSGDWESGDGDQWPQTNGSNGWSSSGGGEWPQTDDDEWEVVT